VKSYLVLRLVIFAPLLAYLEVLNRRHRVTELSFTP
jgi:hypothetical protein